MLKKALCLAVLSYCAVASAQVKLVTTFTILADLAENVAGDKAEVVSITKAGAEIHDYEPTPQDFVNAKGATILVENGLGLERWFERFYQGLGEVSLVVNASEGVEPILIEGGAYNGQPNPHAWMSPKAAKQYVANITEALVKADPDNAQYYQDNASKYVGKIDEIDSKVRQALVQVPADKRVLVTSEAAFSYLVRDYDWKEAYLWPINAEQQGTPKQIASLIKTVREQKIPVVFSESTISDKPIQQVAKETGASYGGVLYVDSLSTKDGKVPTYLDLLQVTTDTIISGFNAGGK